MSPRRLVRIGATGLAAVAVIVLAFLGYRRYPQVIYPLLPYRSLLFPILVFSSIVAPCWLGVRLYLRRRGPHRLSWPREIVLFTAVVYLAAVAAATLTPNRSSRLLAAGRGGVELRPSVASLTCSSPTLPRGSTARGFCIRNARGNVMLFFPLGILIPLVWSHLRLWRGMLIAMALSFTIELLQFLSSAWGSYRAADVNDFILNVVGAGIGLACVSLLRLRRATRG